jgi:hypothetical protein
MDRLDAILFVEVALPIGYGGDRYRFNSPLLQPGMIAATYRFKNLDQLQQLLDGLQIPEYLVNPEDRCRYHREELILIVLERCALGTKLLDLQNKYHRNHGSISKAISFFCSWIQEHWGYLLHDHLAFWQPYMRESRDAIVLKIRDFYPDRELNIQNLHRIASFMDCVIFGTCRPGGGPMEAGPGARRFPEYVQRGFYNRWAKKHGMKKQSCCLANGMALDVGQSFSCRRNDLHLLRESDLNHRMTVLTADKPPAERFQLYGDSAYIIMDSITCADDEDQFGDIKAGMNSCRESIEWMYRDIKIMWAITSSKYKLKLLEDFVQTDYLLDI